MDENLSFWSAQQLVAPFWWLCGCYEIACAIGELVEEVEVSGKKTNLVASCIQPEDVSVFFPTLSEQFVRE